MAQDIETVGELAVAGEAPGQSALACLVIVARQRGVDLSAEQIIRDNMLMGGALTLSQILSCARRAGLDGKALRLGWSRLSALRKTLPVLVRLKNGEYMVLRRIEGTPEDARLVLQDSRAEDSVLLTVDRIRFEAAWSGDVILIKRNFDIADETQPFSIRLVAAMMFRERWVVRDIAICAIVLSFLALAPIVFWRLLSDRVIYYKAYSTLSVLCLAMIVVVLFEAIFSFIRQYLVSHLTTRVDVGPVDLPLRQASQPADRLFRAHAGRSRYA